ncbi:hypothetical protein ACLIA0_06865 [Bacillaceae bacterium W0354]
MTIDECYELCQRHMGRPVAIRTKDGAVHRGVIERVNRQRVFIRPIDQPRNLGGFGLGFYGPGFGYGGFGYRGFGFGGFGFGIALGAIATLAAIPFWF